MLLTVISIAVVSLTTIPLIKVDQEPRGPVAKNDTGAGIVIYTVDPDGSEYLFGVAAPVAELIATDNSPRQASRPT